MTIVAETELAWVERGEDGILRLLFVDGGVANRDTVASVVEAHIQVAGERPWPTLVDTRGLRSADRAARALAAGERVTAVVSRMALLVGGPLSAVIANFFVRVTGPTYPIRVFSDEERALAWLREDSAHE